MRLEGGEFFWWKLGQLFDRVWLVDGGLALTASVSAVAGRGRTLRQPLEGVIKR